MKHTQKNKFLTGFTYVELLIVIAIIGILASIVIVRLESARELALIAKAQEDLHSIRNTIQTLALDTDEWPGHAIVDDIQSGVSGNELWDLTAQEAGLVATDGLHANWQGPYIQGIPLDPWGNPYFFDTDYDIDPAAGEKWAAVVGSFGPNGNGQNVYDDDNIIILLKEE